MLRRFTTMPPFGPTVLLTGLAAVMVAGAAFIRSEDPVKNRPTAKLDGHSEPVSAQQLWSRLNEAEQNGQYDEALAHSRTIRNHFGELYLINLRAGWLHYLKQDYESAIEAYRRAAVAAPGAVSPLHGLSRCYIAQGQSDLAIRTMNALLLIDPMNAIANRRLADLHFQRQQYANAESYYLKLTALCPEDLDAAAQLGWCYLRQQRCEQARAIFNSILTAAPGHASSIGGLIACDQTPSQVKGD